MNCHQLLLALRAAEVDERRYWVRGQDPNALVVDGSGFLDLDTDGRWFLGSVERGVTTVQQYFTSEEEGCQYLYDLLTAPRTAPLKLTPAEEASALEITRHEEAESRRRIAERKARYHGNN